MQTENVKSELWATFDGFASKLTIYHFHLQKSCISINFWTFPGDKIKEMAGIYIFDKIKILEKLYKNAVQYSFLAVVGTFFLSKWKLLSPKKIKLSHKYTVRNCPEPTISDVLNMIWKLSLLNTFCKWCCVLTLL